MRILISNNGRLRLLTPLFCSIGVLVATQAFAGGSPSLSLNADAERGHIVESGRLGYVGGSTRLGVSIDKNMQGQVDLNQIISEDGVSATSVEGWFGYQLKDKNGAIKGVKGGGVKLNHLWAVGDGRYEDDTVHKVFGAYDRNVDDHAKVTAGYGQEQQDLFWSGHVSKGVSDKKAISGTGNAIKAYDYGVGAEVGTFFDDSLTRLRGGVDYEWGIDQADSEDKPIQATLSAGVQQYFYDSPHSLTLDISASKKSGGMIKKEITSSNARLGYQYEFGKDGVFQSDLRIKRTRVEVPGTAAIAAIPAIPAIAGKPATYAKKAIQKPYTKLVKTTMKLENETFFKLNSAKLTTSAKENLVKIAAEIRRNRYTGSIRITGNTCGLGSVKYDQILSERRAKTVKQFLIGTGFNPVHLISRGLGKGHPKYPNGPEAGFKNRRVDIEYVTQRTTKKKAYKTEYKNVLVSAATSGTAGKAGKVGKAGIPARFIWQTEEIRSTPLWIKRALHNPIRHKRGVDTYQTQTAPAVAPVDDSYTLVNRNSLLNVLENDGSGLVLIDIVAAPAHGVATIENGQVRYIVNDDYEGEDKFTYEVKDSNGNKQTAIVSVIVLKNIGNVGLIAVDDELTTTLDTAVTHNIISNDTDANANGDTLSLVTVSIPPYGIVTKNGNEITYTPNAGFSGTDIFIYTVSDSKGHEATATVTIKVGSSSMNQAPVLSPNYAAVYGNGSVMIPVLDDDSDPDNDTLSLVGISEDPNYGTVTLVGDSVRYEPNSNENRQDTFRYEATDNNGHTMSALVTIDIKKSVGQHVGASDDYMQVNTGSTEVTLNVIENDSDREGHQLVASIFTQPNYGTAILSGTNVTFIPDANYKGSDEFDYKVCDIDNNCDTATVFISGSAQSNAHPVILSINTFTVIRGETTALDISAFVSDSNGDTVRIATAEALSGSLTFNDLVLQYTPKDTATDDRIKITVDDDNGGTATATILIKIN
jgi:outer membrane protein OmpA-like peptidoglycan-associated protein